MKTLLLLFLISLNSYSSVCSESKKFMTCKHKKMKLKGLYADREVFYALPETKAPRAGYPVAIFFQGSFFPLEFKRYKTQLFGAYNEILTIKELLDKGFMVVAPKAGASMFWQSNLIPLEYEISSDRYFIDKVLLKLERQSFGPADINNLFAFGISSGGYMTDRMAHSHQHTKFNALAIASGSYARCGGPYCPMPKEILSDHPPTLFLHGKKDIVVPLFTMKKYQKLLNENGVLTKMIVNPNSRHQWLPESPQAITSWFKEHLILRD